jgi:hypothetical protein
MTMAEHCATSHRNLSLRMFTHFAVVTRVCVCVGGGGEQYHTRGARVAWLSQCLNITWMTELSSSDSQDGKMICRFSIVPTLGLPLPRVYLDYFFFPG